MKSDLTCRIYLHAGGAGPFGRVHFLDDMSCVVHDREQRCDCLYLQYAPPPQKVIAVLSQMPEFQPTMYHMGGDPQSPGVMIFLWRPNVQMWQAGLDTRFEHTRKPLPYLTCDDRLHIMADEMREFIECLL